MTTSADDTIYAGSDSFWEPGQYRRSVKRVDDGYLMCKELIQMIKDRCDIETKYAHMLKKHSEEWNKKLDSGAAYGTLKSAWKGVLRESDQQHDIHLEVKDRLLEQVVTHIKGWQKESYAKQSLPGGFATKQAKDADSNFRRAQKPWAKLLEKVNKAKSDYHVACRKERTALNQEQNSRSDTGKSDDDRHKAQDRLQKCRDERAKTLNKYQQALNEINNYNSKYMDDMRQAFETCQQWEEKRLCFFKEALHGIQKCLNLDENPRLKEVYSELYNQIENADSTSDLKYWSDHHGVGMAMDWPQFEEYNPDANSLSKKEKKGGAVVTSNDGVTLTGIKAEQTPAVAKQPTAPSLAKQTTTSVSSSNSSTQPPVTNGGSQEPYNNPFGADDDWGDVDDALVDDGREGVPVRALYDYEGAEEDELTFKQGEVFEKLEDEDEQGWCKGRHEGRVGLYPANYVEVV